MKENKLQGNIRSKKRWKNKEKESNNFLLKRSGIIVWNSFWVGSSKLIMDKQYCSKEGKNNNNQPKKGKNKNDFSIKSLILYSSATFPLT